MEVKIGVQHAPRELVDRDRRDRRATSRSSSPRRVAGDGVLALTDTKGRRVLVPADEARLRRDRRRHRRPGRLPQLTSD